MFINFNQCFHKFQHQVLTMSDGIRVVDGVEWWQGDDGAWFFRKQGTAEWIVDDTATVPK